MKTVFFLYDPLQNKNIESPPPHKNNIFGCSKKTEWALCGQSVGGQRHGEVSVICDHKVFRPDPQRKPPPVFDQEKHFLITTNSTWPIIQTIKPAFANNENKSIREIPKLLVELR